MAERTPVIITGPTRATQAVCPPFSGAVIFDRIEDALAAMGVKPDISPKAQAERRAWQDEAAMTPRERKEACEARARARAEAAE